MSSLKQLPEPISHLKARLRSLKRPMVWGPALILGLIVLFTVEYWFHPNWFSARKNDADGESSFNPSLSPEDSAIGADIDSLALLLKQFDGSIQPPDKADQPAAAKAKPGLFDVLTQEPNSTSKDTALENGLTADNPTEPTRQTRPSSLLDSPEANSRTTSSGVQEFTTPSFMGVQALNAPATSSSSAIATGGTGAVLTDLNLFGTAPPSSGAPLPVSPLQAALDQSRVNTSPSINPSNSVSTTAPPTSVAGASVPGTSTQAGFQTGSTVPGAEGAGINYSTSPVPSPSQAPNAFDYLTSPSAGTGTTNFSGTPTVPSLPSAPVVAPVPSNIGGSTIGQPPAFSSSQPSTGLNNSGSFSTPNNPPTSTVPNNSRPFSAPRRIPGRYIGGGEINTFSNP